MRFAFVLLAAAALLGPLSLRAAADEGPLDKSEPKGITSEEIIQRFATKEKEFKEARDQYTYRQSVKVQTVEGDTVDGEYQEVFDVVFDDQRKRVENVVFAPQNSLVRIQMSPEDLDDIRHRLPFVLTSDEVGEYQILYVGQQQEDELHCYVFDIAPKEIVGKKRYFQGRIWVDDHDFQIVKTYGKNVPDLGVGKHHGDSENLFPNFTTWRQQIDGQYWFRVYTKVDDELHFTSGDVHVKQVVKYTNYKRFGAKSKIIYEGQEVPKGDQTQPGTQQPSKTPAPPKQ